MKDVDRTTADIRRRLANAWHTDLATDTRSWPHTFSLGRPSRHDLERDFPAYQELALSWRSWARKHGVDLAFATRRVHGTSHQLPTTVTIPDLDTAARIAGPDWVQRLARARHRHTSLAAGFPHAMDIPGAVRATDGYTDVDFDILLRAASWLAEHPATRLTPRQVPIEGLHAKWLNTRRPIIRNLLGRDLGLLPDHPARIHFTYLDPDHIAGGGRRHDSATVGDATAPAYAPTLVLISENKDTAVHFPALPGGIAVEGDGFGAGTAARFPWITDAPALIYWGDMDAAGFEILHGYRQAGIPVRSVLMDRDTYDHFERYGTATDKNGRPLGVPARKSLPLLTDAEAGLYRLITEPTWHSHRRIEQERIPLQRALEVVREEARRTQAPVVPRAGWRPSPDEPERTPTGANRT